MASSDNFDRELHYSHIINVFESYRSFTLQSLDNKITFLKSLPLNQQELLQDYSKHLEEMKLFVDHNAKIVQLIVNNVENVTENIPQDGRDVETRAKQGIMMKDFDKMYRTLRQIVRDWSTAGAEERQQCYGPILEAIDKLYPEEKTNRSKISMLVPGAGLGRLSYEIANKGFTCQRNELSLFMLFASNFILRSNGVDCYTMYPWVHSSTNVVSPKDQFLAVTFPDVNPSYLPPTSQLTAAIGNFLEIYREENTWDCVVTCFFIDCTKNIVDFIQTIYKILQPGGYWINLGPLLYEFADKDGEDSIEPTYEHLVQIIKKVGFNINEERRNVSTTYTKTPHSMLKYEYKSIFLVATKQKMFSETIA